MKASGLAKPSCFATMAGSPKIPDPIIPLRASAVRSHRVNTRSSEGVLPGVTVCAAVVIQFAAHHNMCFNPPIGNRKHNSTMVDKLHHVKHILLMPLNIKNAEVERLAS